MKSTGSFIAVGLLAVPGMLVLLVMTIQDVLQPAGWRPPVSWEMWLQVVGLFSGLASPFATVAAVVVTRLNWNSLASARPWAFVVCVLAAIGSGIFWGAMNMIGYRGY